MQDATELDTRLTYPKAVRAQVRSHACNALLDPANGLHCLQHPSIMARVRAAWAEQLSAVGLIEQKTPAVSRQPMKPARMVSDTSECRAGSKAQRHASTSAQTLWPPDLCPCSLG